MTSAIPPALSPPDRPTAEPPSASGPPVRPQLRRSGTDKMLGGVCGGLAAHTGIDAVLWRVAFVGLTLAGGAGVVLYAALWVLTPPAPLAPGEQPRPVDALVDRLAGRHHGVA